ncbi:MAG: TOBE domain-containing protein, partial [Thermomicrobiales bacterium]
PSPNATVARVELIEPVGPVTYLDLMIGGRALRASVAGSHRHQVGDDVAVAFEAGRVHFFDAGSGDRIAG